MKINEGPKDRKIRIVVGIGALILGFFILTGTLKSIVIVVGIVSLVTGITGFCALYKLLGIDTLKKDN